MGTFIEKMDINIFNSKILETYSNRVFGFFELVFFWGSYEFFSKNGLWVFFKDHFLAVEYEGEYNEDTSDEGQNCTAFCLVYTFSLEIESG